MPDGHNWSLVVSSPRTEKSPRELYFSPRGSFARKGPLSGVVYAILRDSGTVGRTVLVVPTRKEAQEAIEAARLFAEREEAVFFPSLEINPYERTSPDRDIIAERIRAMSSLVRGRARLVVTTGEAITSFVVPRGVFKRSFTRLSKGDEFPRDELVVGLERAGYERIPEVTDPGDFAVRGGVVDVFPPDSENPVRIEFFGDEIESIRLFDPTTQRTLREVESISICPGSEVLRETNGNGDGGFGEVTVLADFLRDGIRGPGLEFYTPWIYGETGRLLDYVGSDVRLVFYSFEEIRDRVSFLRELSEDIRNRAREPLPDPELLFGGLGELLELAGDDNSLIIDDFPPVPVEGDREPLGVADVPGTSHSGKGMLKKDGLMGLVRRARSDRSVLVVAAPSAYRVDVFRRLLEDEDVYPAKVEVPLELKKLEEGGVYLVESGIRRGFRDLRSGLTVVTDFEIFGTSLRKRDRVPLKRVKFPQELLKIGTGDLVVHENYGIGRYLGLKKVEVGDKVEECAVIEYAGGDKLYLPVYKLDLLHPYVGVGDYVPALDRLGSRKWENAKRKVKERVQKVAAELLEIYARRELARGFAFEPPDALFEEFAGAFEYEETPDQERAILDVIEDMTSEKPMDRLVCGDVGYGKTEVALRAAFLAVSSGKQVAFLCPTTVLAEQHFRTFRRRFEQFPVRIECLSRFVPAARQREIVQLLRDGKVDIVIGTHRLLQRDVDFADLGLVIIDEEQKFGVVHKEKLKSLRASVDVLTLTATPIPRTLHIALSGIKDISIISTPPRERLAIRTFVVEFSEGVVREAISRELRRGGQVYYVHNRIESIGEVETMLREMFPRARIAVAHGKMNELELERVMRAFYAGDVDILLSTAIVESGLDVPRANTMIIDRAHTFGLSQLYQLKGRIGRDRRRAYAYLLVPPRKELSKEAVARLKAIEEMQELGSGFTLASYDLDIRGAGDILGPNQSGQVKTVGYSMYVHLLEEAVRELRDSGRSLFPLPEVELGLPAYIPDEYVQDPQLKLDFYRKMTFIRDREDWEELQRELEDRCGSPPEPVLNLMIISLLRASLSRFGVRELKRRGRRLFISFLEESPVDRHNIVRLLARKGGRMGFDRRGTLFWESGFDGRRFEDLARELEEILGEEVVRF